MFHRIVGTALCGRPPSDATTFPRSARHLTGRSASAAPLTAGDHTGSPLRHDQSAAFLSALVYSSLSRGQFHVPEKGEQMNGVVVAPQPYAAEVGAEMLRQGGNAFDAAVATAFVQAALDPFMCGIGGIGVAHLFDATSGASFVLEFYRRLASRPRA